MTSKHALIFGASGISGNSLCNELLVYPTKETFSKITGLTNRPLSIKEAELPNDTRLELVSGIDLSDTLEDVKKLLSKNVKDVKNVTHVFFMAYMQQPDYDALREVNVSLLKTAIAAVDALSPNLEHVILQTGGKAYGVEFPDKVDLKAPFKESLPRVPEPYASKIFYYSQTDALSHIAQGKAWKWTEVRPDAIVGFVPTSNAMNIAGPLAVYLSLYRYVHGANAEVPFPASEKAWTAKHSDTSSYILSRFEIYAALAGNKTSERVYNIADGDVTTWEKKWGGLCKYFELKPGKPDQNAQLPEEFYKTHADAWKELMEKRELANREEGGWWFLQGVMKGEFDRQYDLSAAREIGFDETIDTVKAYTRVFDKMRKVKYIP